MEKKAINGKMRMIIGAVVVLLAMLGVAGYIISRGSTDREESLLELGQRYLDELNYEQAIVCFEEYLEIDPKCVEAYAGLAEAYVGLEKYEKALQVLADGYAATRDGSLQEMSSRIEEQYREWLLAQGGVDTADGTDTSDGTDEDWNQGQETDVMESTEPLVLDTSTVNVIAGNGGVIITRENELYGAINYQGEEIVPHVYPYYIHIPTEEGYFALGDESEVYIFDFQGEIVYEITEDYGQFYISEGVVLYSLYYSEEGEVCWYDLETKNLNSVILSPDVSITQVQDGKFNAWQENTFWTVDKNGSVEKIEEAVWGLDSFDHASITVKADGYIPMFLWYWEGGFGLLDETDVHMIWYTDLMEIGLLEVFYPEYKTYLRDGLWLCNRGTQIVVTDDEDHSTCVLLDLSRADTAPAVQESDMHYGNAATYLPAQPAGRITNIEDVVLAVYDDIQLSDSGIYLASDGDSWFYLDENGQRIDQNFLDCSAFYNGLAIVIDTDGMAYLINTEFNRVSDGYPADRVYTAGAVYCAVSGDQVTILIDSEK